MNKEERIEIVLKERKVKQVLNIDKLEISYLLNEQSKLKLSLGVDYVGEFFSIIKIIDDDKKVLWHEVYLTTNELFGKIVFGANYFNKDRIYFQIENKMLYDDFLPIANDVASLLNLEFHSISRLDLALDFNKNIINKFYKMLKDDELKLKILNVNYGMDDDISTLLHLSSGTRRNIRKYKSFYIQNAEDNLILNAYDKMKEIQDNNFKKMYIVDSVNMSKIFRLEIRTHHNTLVDSLHAIGFTDEYLYYILLNKHSDELYLLFNHLLNRIIQINYKRKTYSILDYIV